MRVAVFSPRPSLDPCEQALDSRTILLDLIAVPFALIASPASISPPDQDRDKVLLSREEEHIGFLSVAILRKPLLCFARNRRRAQRPADAKHAIARSGIVGQRDLRAEPRARRARADRDAQRACTCHCVGSELLADPTDSSAALGQVDLRRAELGRRTVAVRGLRHRFLRHFGLPGKGVTAWYGEPAIASVSSLLRFPGLRLFRVPD